MKVMDNSVEVVISRDQAVALASAFLPYIRAYIDTNLADYEVWVQRRNAHKEGPE